MRIEELKGRQFSGVIKDTDVEGRIQVEDGRVYLCQDKKAGDDCSDKLGYKYSWVLACDPRVRLSNGLTEFKLIGCISPEQFHEGSRFYFQDELVEVMWRHDDIFILGAVVDDEVTRTFGPTYHIKEIYSDGYKLIEPVVEETKEVTMDEIASKFNIPVEKLKIKKD